MTLRTAFLTALVILSAAASAAEPLDDPVAACYTQAATQIDYTACLKQELEKVTQDYKAVLERVSLLAKGLDRAEKKKSASAALNDANRTFDAYLNKECVWTAASYGSGSGAGAAELACRVNLTRLRQGWLRSQYLSGR